MKWLKSLIPALALGFTLALLLGSGCAANPKPPHHGWKSRVCHHQGCDLQIVA